MKNKFLLLLCLIWAGVADAQELESVRVRVIVPTPHTDRLSYYGEPGRVVVTLTNRTNRVLELYLRGSIKGIDNDRHIYTDPNFRPDNSYAISVPAGVGQTITVPSNFIQDVYDVNNFVFSGTSANEIKRAGRLGEGCYTVCISAWDMRDHTQRLSLEEMGCATICVRNVEAPILIKPYADEIIKPLPVQNIIFSWNRPAGTPPTVRYKLKIVEIFDPSRNPNDAFLSATTPAFFETEVMGNAFVYDVSAPPLAEGRKYAWAVTAIDPTGETAFQNGGRSEIRAFTYQGVKRFASPFITKPEANSVVSAGSDTPFEISWVANDAPADTRYNLRLVELSGSGSDSNAYSESDAEKKLANDSDLFYQATVEANTFVFGKDQPPLQSGRQYAVQVIARDPAGKIQFERGGQSQTVLFKYGGTPRSKVEPPTDSLPKIPTQITGRLLYKFSDDLQGRLFPVANQTVYLRKVYAKRSVDQSGKESLTRVRGLNGIFESAILDGVTVETDEDGNFILDCGMTEQDSSGIIAQENWTKYANPDGLPFTGEIGVYYVLETTTPHFKPYAQYLQISPGGSNNLSNIVLDANSYTLALNVQEVFNQLKGNFVGDAKVRIYREARYKNEKKYGIPTFEGDILTPEALQAAQREDKVLIAERTTPVGPSPDKPAGFTVYFNHLFRATDTDAYRYKIVLENGAKVISEVSYDNLVTALVPSGNKVNQSAAASNLLAVNTANLNKAGLSSLLADTENRGGKTFNGAAPSQPAQKGVPTPAKVENGIGDKFGQNILQTKDKWLNFHYNSKPDTAYLTLEKELVVPPRTKVKGRLSYAFKNNRSIPAVPYANMPVKLMVCYLVADPADNRMVSVSQTVTYNPSGNYYSATIQNAANHKYLVIENYKLQDQRNIVQLPNGKTVADNFKVLETVYTDDQGNFEFDFPNAEETGVAQAGVLWNGLSGDLSVHKNVNFKRVYRVVPDVAYYCAPDDDVIVQPFENKDIGSLVSFVQTFNLRVKVEKTNREKLPDKVEKFSNVPVNMYRVPQNSTRGNRPVVSGVDQNKSVVLFGAPANSGGQTAGTSAPKQSNSGAFTAHYGQTYNGFYVSKDAEVSASVSSYQLTSASAVSAGQSLVQNYILQRSASSDAQGEILFKDVVKSLGDEDVILLQADNNDREGTTNFKMAYLEFPKQRTNTPTYSDHELDSRLHFKSDATPAGAVNPLRDGPTFNSEFDPNETATANLRVLPGGTLVRGRVTDHFTDLGVKGVLLELNVVVSDEKLNLPGFKRLIRESVTTDENGYFAFKSTESWLTSLKPEDFPLITNQSKSSLRVIYAPGYELPDAWEFDVSGAGPDEGRTGKQIVIPFVLKPIGRGAYGYVVDQENPDLGVAARVQNVHNGKWVDTRSFFAAVEQAGSNTNMLESSGMYLASLTAAVQLNAQAASASGTSKTTTLGSFGTLNTSLSAGKVTTTLTVDKNNPESLSHPLANAAVGLAQGNAGFTTNISKNSGSAAADLARPWKDVQRFDIDLPAKPVKLVIRPYDPAYLTDTVEVDVKKSFQYLGKFELRKRKHNLTIKVVTTDGLVVRDAQVSIDEAGDEVKYTNASGQATFLFVNNSTENLTVRVKNRPEHLSADNSGRPSTVQRSRSNITLIVPKTVTNVHSKDDLQSRQVTIVVERAQLVNGRVLFEQSNTPVANALVYVDEGKGSDSDIHTRTDETGAFTLALPFGETENLLESKFKQFGLKITASYAQAGKSYVGSTVTLNGNQLRNPPQVNLTIREIEGIDLSQILGFTARLKSAEKLADNSYRISGELLDKPGNENFALSKTETGTQVLAFSDLEVVPSGLKNENGVPLAVPVGNELPLLNREIVIQAFEVYKVKVSNAQDQPLVIRKAGTDTSAVLEGQVRILDNSFNFPTSYLTISKQDFFLGKFGVSNVAEKLTIPVLKSGQTYPLTKFSLSTDQGKPINFKYLGFDGTAETTGERESFIRGDEITLFMNLNTKIQGGIPVKLESGKAILKHDKLEKIETNESIVINLENWKVTAKSWELSNTSGGIVLNDNVIFTGRADVPMKKISIISSEYGGNGELIFNDSKGSVDTKALKNNLFLGGNAKIKLHVYNNTEVTFAYDPDVGRIPGQGHFKFTLKTDDGSAAYLQGLEGMRSGDKMNIQYVSILSNNEELFAFTPNASSVTYYNQITFSPRSIYSSFDRLIISGSVQLYIPNTPTVEAELSYWPTSGAGNRLVIKPFDFEFTGNGGTRFRAITSEGAQIIKPKGFGIVGKVTLPGYSGTITAQLQSLVTDKAESGAQFVERQLEVVVGRYHEETKNMAAVIGDKVLGNSGLAGLRNSIEEQINQAYNFYNQKLPMGGDAGQVVKDIAGRWRLVGQGMDVINQIDNNPVGALMQLNGLIDGAVGINIKNEARNKAKLIAMEAVKAIQDEVPIDALAKDGMKGSGGMPAMQFDFDFVHGRVFGSMSTPVLETGAVKLEKLGMELLFDGSGWYFYTGAHVNVRAVPLIFPVATGMLIGNYRNINPVLEARVTEVSISRKLPNTIRNNGIRGFYMAGRKDIIEEISFGVNFVVADFEVGVRAGLEARLYANFGEQETELGIGAMVFAHAYAKLSLLGCSIGGSVDGQLGAKVAFKLANSSPSFTAAACASVRFNAHVACLVSGDIDVGVQAKIKLCAGSNCAKTLDWSARLSSEACSESNDFDF